MALHIAQVGREYHAISSMLVESLDEMVRIAKYCVFTKKDTIGEGVFGYPGVILLLCVIDALGSYLVGGNVENHFKVLNSSIFNLHLDDKQIRNIYDYFRSPLGHHLVMPEGVGMAVGRFGEPPFTKKSLVTGKVHYVINVQPLYRTVEKAVSDFKKMDVDTIVKNSEPYSRIFKKPRIFK